MQKVRTRPEHSERANVWCRNKWRATAWGAAVVILFFPLVLMQFTAEVNWDITDFIVFAAMLGTAGASLEFAARMTSNKAYRAAVGVALAAAFILVWMNLAVGIIGNEGHPANLMYFGVLVVGLVGAISARCQPEGMVHAMIATAIAQALVAVIALLAGLGHTFVITSVFVVLWLVSAGLFKKSVREVPEC